MARIPNLTKALLVLAGILCATLPQSHADQILLDSGATLLDTTAPDADTLQAGGNKLKQWAADINTMNAELYSATSGTVYSIANCPGVVLDGTTDDAPAINACIAAQPAGTTFMFPSGKTIGLKGPLTGFKTGQRFIGNGTTLQAITVSAALGASLSNGAMSVTVADRTGFTCGQIIKAGSRNADTSATLTNSFNFVTGVAGDGICDAATGPGALYVATAFATCGTLTAEGGCGVTPTISTGAGVNVISAGVLFYNASSSVTDIEIAGFTLDGARPVGGNVNLRIPRWEADKIIETNRGGRAYVHDLLIQNADGDGVSVAGDFSRVFNIRGVDVGGNLVHFSQGYYQQAARISGTNINLAGGFMGHQDGLITYSNKCNYSILSDLNAYNAKRVIGGLDAYGGTHFVATNLVGTNLTDGPFRIANASTTFTGTTTSGSATVSGLANTYGLLIGQNLSGTGIPAGSYITAVGTTTVTMSANATASGSQTITLMGGASDITIANGIFDNSNSATAGLIKLEGGTTDGNRLRGVSIRNIVAKHALLWGYGVEHADIAVTIDNDGRSTLPTVALPANTSSILLEEVRDSELRLNVAGGKTGVTVQGSTTRNLRISGVLKNQQGSPDARGVYLANSLPTTPEVHLSHLTLVGEAPPATAWAGSTAYSVGAVRSNGESNYVVRVAGTSASSGGPTGANASITDGTVTWGFLNTPGRYTVATGSTGYMGINATAAFTLTDSVVDITGGSRLILMQPGTASYQVELRRNIFRRVSGYNSCCRPIQVTATLSRFIAEDNSFTGYDTGVTQDLFFFSVAQNDLTILRNTVSTPSTGNIIRVNGNTARSVIKDNVFPYRAGAGSTWTTPTTWAEQTTTSADPIYLNGTGTDDLIIGNVMRKAVSP